MAAAELINLSGLLDDAKCFAFVRQQRWPESVRCPGCDSEAVIRDGCDDTQPCRRIASPEMLPSVDLLPQSPYAK